MANASEIGWGKYSSYEGPFYRGKFGFKLSSNPSEEERVIAVITATEGGHYDAINMYDRGVISSGLVQWLEANQYSVSNMLGVLAARSPDYLRVLYEQTAACGVDFHVNAKGQWRFFFRDARGEVNTLEEQQQLFLKTSGRLGSWTEEAKAYAKQWAAVVASIWEYPAAQVVQLEYTVAHLAGFCLPYALDFVKMTPPTPVGRAFRALYYSFAANNPTHANTHLEIANKASHNTYWTNDWLIAVARELTFGPKIAIYPARYRAIRPVLEKLYGVDLPDMDTDLKRWQASTGLPASYDTSEVRVALVGLGYDLGPLGVEGGYDEKVQDAVLHFQQTQQLPNPDGHVTVETAAALARALEMKGAQALQNQV